MPATNTHNHTKFSTALRLGFAVVALAALAFTLYCLNWAILGPLCSTLIGFLATPNWVSLGLALALIIASLLLYRCEGTSFGVYMMAVLFLAIGLYAGVILSPLCDWMALVQHIHPILANIDGLILTTLLTCTLIALVSLMSWYPHPEDQMEECNPETLSGHYNHYGQATGMEKCNLETLSEHNDHDGQETGMEKCNPETSSEHYDQHGQATYGYVSYYGNSSGRGQ